MHSEKHLRRESNSKGLSSYPLLLLLNELDVPTTHASCPSPERLHATPAEVRRDTSACRISGVRLAGLPAEGAALGARGRARSADYTCAAGFAGLIQVRALLRGRLLALGL